MMNVVVVTGKERNNSLVTTVFNDAFASYMMSKDRDKSIEVWDEGECVAVYTTMDDFIKAKRLKAFIHSNE